MEVFVIKLSVLLLLTTWLIVLQCIHCQVIDESINNNKQDDDNPTTDDEDNNHPTTTARHHHQHHRHNQYDELIQSYINDSCILTWQTGEEMKQYLLSIENQDRCIITLTGATWDAHFKHYLQSRIYQRAAQLFCAIRPFAHDMVVDFGLFFYQVEKLPHMLVENNYLGEAAEEVIIWQPSDPTFEIYVFRNGSLVTPENLENIHHGMSKRPRSCWLRQFRDWSTVSDEEIMNSIKEMCGSRPYKPEKEGAEEEEEEEEEEKASLLLHSEL